MYLKHKLADWGIVKFFFLFWQTRQNISERNTAHLDKNS